MISASYQKSFRPSFPYRNQLWQPLTNESTFVGVQESSEEVPTH